MSLQHFVAYGQTTLAFEKQILVITHINAKTMR